MLHKIVGRLHHSSQLCFPSFVQRSLSSVVVPPNLALADASVLLPPRQTLPSIPEMEFYFAPLEFNDTIDVIRFKPDEQGEGEVPTIKLDGNVFNVAIRKDIVHQVVRYQRAAMRQPNKTKRIGEISGSGKKPWPQKGQGRSQVGNKRNSAWRGGQKAHGPVIRDFSFSLNREYRAMAMMIVLTTKLREGNLLVFDNFDLGGNGKTKDLLYLLKAHAIDDCSIAVVDNDFTKEFILASRNLMRVKPFLQTHANVYDLVRRTKLAISVDALEELQERLKLQYNYSGKRQFYTRQASLLSVNMNDLAFEEGNNDATNN